MAQRHYQRGREPTEVSLYTRLLAIMFTCYGNFIVVDTIVMTTTYHYYYT